MIYEELCREAYKIQDASNILPVINLLYDAVKAERSQGGDWNGKLCAPVQILIDKIISLAQYREDTVLDFMSECTKEN